MAYRARDRAGSGAEVAGAPWEREWAEVEARDPAEAVRAAHAPRRRRIVLLILLAIIAATVAGILPLTPGFSTADTIAALVAAGLTACLSIAVVPAAESIGRRMPGSGAADPIVFAAALASAGAAAIHFSVAKTHFAEYALFGVFFVLSGAAQLAWPIWLLLRRWQPLIALGAAGNALIVALWAVDRIWGLPLGPTPWEPDPLGFGDIVASGLELLLVGCCVWLLVRPVKRSPRNRWLLMASLGAAFLTLLALLSVLGVGSSVLTPTE